MQLLWFDWVFVHSSCVAEMSAALYLQKVLLLVLNGGSPVATVVV